MDDLQSLVSHILFLAQKHEIELIFDPNLKPHEAAAYVRSIFCPVHRVFARPVTEETSYAVVLHEMGHCVADRGSLNRERMEVQLSADLFDLRPSMLRLLGLRLEEETAAWDWAMRNALYWSAGMESVRRWALSTYQESFNEFAKPVANEAEMSSKAVKLDTLIWG